MHSNNKHEIFKKICFSLLFAVFTGYTSGVFTCDPDNKNYANDEVLKKDLLDFTKYAESIRREWRIPGMAIAIVRNNSIIYTKGFGVRNIALEPVTPNTIFAIGSLTKSFTATLLALQVDDGKYSWNTKVKDIFPAFKLYNAQDTKNFEIRDLMAHNSGLPADSLSHLGEFGYDVNHIIYSLRFIKPVASFRTTFAYQNVFFEVAKKIIEDCSKTTYENILRQKIFIPLGMTRSYVVTDNFSNVKDIAQPFLYYLGKVIPYPTNFPYLSKNWALRIGLAGGGIKSSTTDMAKWLIFNMNNGIFNEEQLVSNNAMKFVHSPQINITQNSKEGMQGDAYGGGWFYDKETYKNKTYTVVYHAGSDTGMHSAMAYIPEMQIGIVILTNQYTNAVPEILIHRFFDTYFNKFFVDMDKKKLAERIQNDKSILLENNKCQVIKNAQMTKYTGVYYNPIYGKLTVKSIGTKLILTIGPQRITWSAAICKDNTFRAYWLNPSDLPFPMLYGDDTVIKFTTDIGSKKINKMFINYLNSDGGGVFIKE